MVSPAYCCILWNQKICLKQKAIKRGTDPGLTPITQGVVFLAGHAAVRAGFRDHIALAVVGEQHGFGNRVGDRNQVVVLVITTNA